MEILLSNPNRLHSAPSQYPFRFHCLRLLTKFAGDANTFIPILGYILEVCLFCLSLQVYTVEEKQNVHNIYKSIRMKLIKTDKTSFVKLII